MAPSTLQDPETRVVIGAAMKVHRVLGCGFNEPVYQGAMAVELRRRDITFASQVGFAVEYDGEPLHLTYRADFVCYDALSVEIKALSSLGPIEEAQVLNYLKVSRLKRALLLNFDSTSLHWRRFVW